MGVREGRRRSHTVLFPRRGPSTSEKHDAAPTRCFSLGEGPQHQRSTTPLPHGAFPSARALNSREARRRSRPVLFPRRGPSTSEKHDAAPTRCFSLGEGPQHLPGWDRERRSYDVAMLPKDRPVVAGVSQEQDHGRDAGAVTLLERYPPEKSLYIPWPRLRLDRHPIRSRGQQRIPRSVVARGTHGDLEPPFQRRCHPLPQAGHQGQMCRVADRPSGRVCTRAELKADDRHQPREMRQGDEGHDAAFDSADLGCR